MSLAVIYTRALLGLEAPLVNVEAHISNGLPGLSLVGLPETAVKEARERVRSALLNSGFTFPAKRITINLAPADLPKEGGRYDLPIALAILAASGQLPTEALTDYEFIGELSLSGELRRVTGILPAALAVSRARRSLVTATAHRAEIALIPDHTHQLAGHLLEVCNWLSGEQTLAPATVNEKASLTTNTLKDALDMADIIGQEQAKRAVEITASGGHNLLLIGPPGTGKTMLASRLNALLPPLSEQEALESLAIINLVSPTLPQNWRQRPFRAPHHSVSLSALVGGGSLPRPGEISLAHNGVLFLDELPEFERRTLDALREPLESGEIIISRAKAKVRFPARFQLIAAMNPSPSGYYKGTHQRSSLPQTLRYLNRLSGPLLDRFDLSVEVTPLPFGALQNRPAARPESSDLIRRRVCAARQIQYQRSGKINAALTGQELERDCALARDDACYLERVLHKLGLSVRAWHRLLRVARTIADLAAEKHIQRHHLNEALAYRAMDRLLQHLLQQQSG